MSKEEVKTERHTETKEEAIKNMRKIVEVEEENHVETKEEAVKRVAEPLSVTIEKAKKGYKYSGYYGGKKLRLTFKYYGADS